MSPLAAPETFWLAAPALNDDAVRRLVDGLAEPVQARLADHEDRDVAPRLDLERLPRPGETSLWTFTVDRPYDQDRGLLVAVVSLEGEHARLRIGALRLEPGDSLRVRIRWGRPGSRWWLR